MSTYLSDRGHRLVLAATFELAELRDPDLLVPAVLTQIRKVIAGELAGYNVFDFRAGTASTTLSPDTQTFREPVENHLAPLLWQHPLVPHFASGTDHEPRRISDVIDIHGLAVNPAYREILVPMGVPRELGFPITRPGGSRVAGFTVNRAGSDFTEEDRARAAMLQPLLVTLIRRRSLLLRPPQQSGPVATDRPGLTRREETVLALLATGMKADAIGRSIGASPRTVRKHLQNIYGKVGVSDRLSAVERARAAGLLPTTSGAAADPPLVSSAHTAPTEGAADRAPLPGAGYGKVFM